MELMKIGLEMDWDNADNENKRPSYTRQNNYVPCGCGRCFHCGRGYTNGIDHKKTKKRKGPVRMNEPCGTERQRLRHNSYCRVCYRREKVSCPDMNSVELKKKSNKTNHGCIVCNMHVCKECWTVHVEHKKV